MNPIIVLVGILLGAVLIKAFAILARPRNDNVVSDAWLRDHTYDRRQQRQP